MFFVKLIYLVNLAGFVNVWFPTKRMIFLLVLLRFMDVFVYLNLKKISITFILIQIINYWIATIMLIKSLKIILFIVINIKVLFILMLTDLSDFVFESTRILKSLLLPLDFHFPAMYSTIIISIILASPTSATLWKY